MKLIFCPECYDIFDLDIKEVKSCHCGQSSGKYLDDLRTVEVSEKAIVICFNNQQFTNALIFTCDDDKSGQNFNAWILPANNRWIRRK